MRRGTHRSTAELERAILAYLDIHNENPRPFIWTKTADQILTNAGPVLSANSGLGTPVKGADAPLKPSREENWAG